MKSEETTKLIMDSALDATICMDTNGSITLWTRQAEKIFGWKEDEIKGKILSEIIIPERYRKRHVNGLKHYLETREARVLNKVIEIEALNRDGKEFPIELAIVSIKQNGDEFFCAFLRDISERKKVEEDLRKSELRYRSLIEQASDAIMITDFRGNFIDVNESLCRMFGYAKEDLLHMNISSLIDPEELKVRPIRFDVLATGQHVFNERRMMHKNGTFIDVEANVKKFGDQRVLAIARDITERKRSEAILKESEFRFRKVTENEILGMAWASPDGRVLNANNTFCKMLGYRLEELQGVYFGDFTHEDDTEKELKLIEDIFQNKTDHYQIEKRYKTKRGDFIWIELNLSCFRNPVDKHIEFFIGIVQNINERKKAEKAIRESEERYRTLVENATEALVVLDVEIGKFVSVSQSAVTLFKMSKEELLKIGPLEISPEYQPDGRLSSQKAPEKLNEAIQGHKPIFEWTHCDKDGNLLPCEIWLVRLPSENQILVRGSIVDISKRKMAEEAIRLSEQKYKLLFNKNPLPMWMLSVPTLNITDANESAIAHYGYSKEEFLSMTAKELRPEEDLTKFLEEAGKDFKGINNYGIWRHKKKDGTIIKVEIITHDIIYEGQPTRLVLAHDVTEKMIAEEQLKQSHEQLRQLSSHLENIREEERTYIAREIHDELGQQLTGLKMDASWLIKKISSEDKIVREKITGMIGLIDDTVKTVRRISSELRPGILDDLGLVDALDWQSNEFEKRTGIRCIFSSSLKNMQFDKKLSTGIFRVYQETLTNVARHARASEIKTTLEGNSSDFILNVHDNGEGFDEKEIISKNTLGLIGMKERATVFGGKLIIESAKGKGTSIIFQVPLKIVSEKADSKK